MVSENPPRDPSIQESAKSSERKRLISLPRSVIPACDIRDLETFERIIAETGDIEEIGGYKVGMMLALRYGLPEVVRRGKKHTNKPFIFDQQKGGTDIPDLAQEFSLAVSADEVIGSGVDAAILFPFAGPDTQEKWTLALQEAGVTVFIGGEMTHPRFLESQGGYIADSAPERMYKLGAEMGVTHFIVPGTKVESVAKYKNLIEEVLGEGNFDLAAPGLITQGGDISEAGQVAGKYFHGIVGRAIYAPKEGDMRNAALQAVSKLK